MTEQKTIAAHETTSDPHENKRPIRVVFVNKAHNFTTLINGTRDEVANYYCGARLNLGVDSEKVLATPIRIEFLSRNPDEPIVSYELPSSKSYLYRGYIIDGNVGSLLSACDYQWCIVGYDGPEDGRCGTAASVADAKQYIDEQIEEDLWVDGDQEAEAYAARLDAIEPQIKMIDSVECSIIECKDLLTEAIETLKRAVSDLEDGENADESAESVVFLLNQVRGIARTAGIEAALIKSSPAAYA